MRRIIWLRSDFKNNIGFVAKELLKLPLKIILLLMIMVVTTPIAGVLAICSEAQLLPIIAHFLFKNNVTSEIIEQFILRYRITIEPLDEN
jgi:hypothetical protein